MLPRPNPQARPRASTRWLAACNLHLPLHPLRQCASRIRGPSLFQRTRYHSSNMSSPHAFLSSPARMERYAHATPLSSSPELPSLGELAQRAPRQPFLRSGSHAAPVPATACSTFTSAKELLRQAPEIDIDTEELTRTPPPEPKPRRKTGAKPEAKSKPTTAPEPAAAQDACIVIASSPSEESEKVWQKSKPQTQLQDKAAQPLADPVQSTIPHGRVTKPVAPSKTKKKTETASRHFPAEKPKRKSHAKTNDLAGNKSVDIPSVVPPATPVDSAPREVAVARRKDWTPPTNSTSVDGPDIGDPASSFAHPKTSNEVFQNLCQDFARQTEPGQPPPPPMESVAELLKKRKHVEVAAADEQGLPLQATSPTKSAAAKKKTRTLTELAMAPYQQVNPDLLAPGNTDSLLNYFEGSDGAVKALVEHQAAVMDFNKSKAKGKGKAKKPAAKPRKKKAGTLEDPILLSPNAAMKQSSNQDFVFGTSSQLMLEESPTFLREMQAAIQASNRADDDPFVSSPTHQATVKRGLWHAGARDSDGDLLELDMVDLVDATRPLALARGQSAEKATLASPNDDVFVDIGDIVDAHGLCPGPSRAPGTTGRTPLASSLPVQVLGSASRPLPEQCQASKRLPPCTLQNFSTTAESSAKASAASKKKPAKSKAAGSPEPEKKARGRPKKDSAAASPKAQSTAATAAVSSPEKPRGRARKNSVSAANTSKDADVTNIQTVSNAKPTTPRRRGKAKQKPTVIEIADSDDDDDAALSQSPPSSPELVFSSPPPMDLSLTDEADMSLNVSPTAEASKLFSLITKAITASPRSTDPTKPSWHEKMLMYEPVVLEDLTEWLNGGELTKVGFDGEVTPTKVKRWCESKSVLSIWRATRNGKERKVL